MDKKTYATAVLTAAIEDSGWRPRKEGERPPAVLIEDLRRKITSGRHVFQECLCYGVPADEAARRIRLSQQAGWSP